MAPFSHQSISVAFYNFVMETSLVKVWYCISTEPPSYKLSRPSWLWSYGSLIYYYLCNQCLSPLTLWVRIPLRRCVLDTTLCDKVCQWLTAGGWFSPGTPVSSTNKTDHYNITEILLKVALSNITLTLNLAIRCVLCRLFFIKLIEFFLVIV
jgi:hypothetical protein